MIQHVLLSDNTLILILPTQTITITPYHLNYWKIRNNINSLSLEEIEALLSESTLKTKLYYAYYDTNSNKLYVVCCQPASDTTNFTFTTMTYRNNNWESTELPKNITYLGCYKSFEDIQNSMPELFL